MMSRYGSVNLAELPLPDALDPIAWTDIVDSLKDQLLERYPDAHDVINDHLEPLVYQIENFAAREMQLRAIWNDKVRAVMLATSTGADLEGLAAQFDVGRMLLDPGDVTASPPRAPVFEDDTRLRIRAQLAPSAFATAGSYEAYVFHALTSDGRVWDAQAYNYASGIGLAPGEVSVVILPRPEITDDLSVVLAVREWLTRPDIKPLTDMVSVQAAQRTPLDVTAVLHLRQGPSPHIVKAAALKNLEGYFEARRRVGAVIAESGIHQALHVSGVEYVTLVTPTGDRNPGPSGTYLQGTLNLTTQVIND